MRERRLKEERGSRSGENIETSLEWWCMSVIPGCWSLMQEDREFKVSLSDIIKVFSEDETERKKK